MNSTTSIDFLPRTASQTIKKLKSCDIHTFGDLVQYYPHRYERNPEVSSIRLIQDSYMFGFDEGTKVAVRGTLHSFKTIFTRNGFKIQKGELVDDSGAIELTWFNQMYLMRVLTAGMHIQVVATLATTKNKLSLVVHEYDKLDDLTSPGFHTADFAPVYSEKNGLSTRVLREKIKLVLPSVAPQMPEPFPTDIIKSNAFVSAPHAIASIHFPKNEAEAKASRQRLAFEELFTIQLTSKIVKKEWEQEVLKKPFLFGSTEQKKLKKIIDSLPFALTETQRTSLDQICSDLSRPMPMNRLLQGDVGSGKTVVAALSAYVTKLNGFSTLLMAPTEILAEQHFKTLDSLFKDTFKTVLFTSAHKPSADELKLADIIVGTHALIAKKVDFAKIGLVIIDEQHKFGVSQRAELKKKAINPHLLTMTATPIPRTVLLTLYGELDMSVINELPKNRLPINTYVVPAEKREAGYEWIMKEIKEHKSQAFIVCPFIDESTSESVKNVKAAKKEYDHLSSSVFKNMRLGLLHGKLKSSEKNTMMQQFGSGEIDILVTTPVVEVGIDFPNATIIVIEGAERFGLAQLHQLRGRVGRGEKQSHCLLYTENAHEKIQSRLSFFSKVSSGYQLAEYDLKHRGAGDMYGTRQHGVSDLKIASLSDFDLIARSDQATAYFMKNYALSDYPILQERVTKYRQLSIARD